MSVPQIQAVVFDVDGVLFDTERVSQNSWLSVSAEMGWPQVGQRYLEFVGQSRSDILQKMLDLFGPDFPREEFLQSCSARSMAWSDRNGIPLKPGVHEILEFLKERQVPTALATSTSHQRTLYRMERTDLGRYFKTITTGDHVTHSKPHPEIYQLACESLGVAPEHALAVEDSRNGILSACAAGMPTVMIPDLIPLSPELEGLIWKKCDSLMELRTVLEPIL